MRALPLLLVLAAGCVTPAAELEDARPAAHDALHPGFEQDHDHRDASLHAGFGHGMETLGYHNLAPGTDGSDASERGAWVNSEIILRGDHAFVGYIGAPWLFSVIDVRDPMAPTLVSVFETANAWTMDLAVSEDGNWVFASVYPGAAGTVFAADYLLQNAHVPSGAPLPGVMVVDVRDKARPAMTGFLPVHGLGPHTATYHRYEDGREVVFANKADAPPANGILVAEVVALPTGGRTLRPLSTFALEGPADASFPHDVDVQRHPLTGRTLLYAAYWQHGLVVVDVTDPAAPTLVSRTADVPEGEEVNVHDVHPYPALVGGRHFTLTAPEMPNAQTTGHLRVWDTTDPAAPVQVSSWTLPGGYVVDKPFSFSPHNFVFLPDGKVALAHGHAGVWVLEWLGADGAPLPEPRVVAWHLPHATGATPPSWTPVEGAPWVWGTAVDAAGNVWASDVAGGLHGLRLAAVGPTAG